jgi:hypothetical protein
LDKSDNTTILIMPFSHVHPHLTTPRWLHPFSNLFNVASPIPLFFPALVYIPDFFAFEPKYHPPTSTSIAFFLSATVGAAYVIWVEYCASINGSFPYPFLTMTGPIGRGIIYVAAISGALGVFRALNGLHPWCMILPTLQSMGNENESPNAPIQQAGLHELMDWTWYRWHLFKFDLRLLRIEGVPAGLETNS